MMLHLFGDLTCIAAVGAGEWMRMGVSFGSPGTCSAFLMLFDRFFRVNFALQFLNRTLELGGPTKKENP